MKRYPYTEALLQQLGDAPQLRGKVVDIWAKRAGSSTFDIANGFADAMPQLDSHADIFLSDEDALNLVIAVVKAAERRAWNSQSLRESHFANTPTIAAKALSHAAKEPEGSEKLVKQAFPATMLEAFLKDELDAG